MPYLCKCGSGIQPRFNIEGKKKPEFCGKCKKDGMVNVVDKNKKCGCGSGIQPYFNIEGKKKGEFCGKCKKDGMVNVVSKICGCGSGIIPCYNIEGKKKAEFCGKCKKYGMVDVVNKICIQEICPVRANYKYKGYCAFCFGHLFPEHPLSADIRTKSKEIITTDYIKDNLPEYEFKYDKQLEIGGCDCSNRRRPDAHILINGTMLCIEVDEFQHKRYNKEDEEARINDLYMAYSGKWVYIRFNPDNYNKKNKKMITPLKDRLPVLLKEILKQIKRIDKGKNTELVEQILLYFDE